MQPRIVYIDGEEVNNVIYILCMPVQKLCPLYVYRQREKIKMDTGIKSEKTNKTLRVKQGPSRAVDPGSGFAGPDSAVFIDADPELRK